MKKKLLILVAMLIMVFGSVISVHAEETTDNENYYFNGKYEVNENNKYVYCGNSILNDEMYEYYIESEKKIFGVINTSIEAFNWYSLYYLDENNNAQVTYITQKYYKNKDGNYEYISQTSVDRICYKQNVSCNIPIFTNMEDVNNYLKNGDYTGCLNYQDSTQKDAYENIEDTYDIPYLQNVKYVESKVDTHNHPFTVSWDTLQNFNGDCRIEILAEVMTKEGLFKSKELTENMYKDYFDNIPYTDGQYTSSIEDVVAKIKGTTDLFAYDIRKLYLRVAMYDATNKKFMSGGWVRLITDRDSETTTMLPLTVKVDTGFIDKTTGEFVKDIKTDSSYNTTIDGKTGTQITDNPNYIVGTDENGNLDLITLGKSFLNSVNGLFTYIKDIPSFIGRLVLFLPQTITGLMGLGILAVIVLRILGR